MTQNNIQELSTTLVGKSPRPILKAALGNFQNIVLSFSGAEDVVLIDMATKIRADIEVFTIDTGRLHAETYQYIESVRKHYNLNIRILSPDKVSLQTFVRDKGLFSFYEDGHQQCCGIRKVDVLRDYLANVDAWITGQRKDQSIDTRAELVEIEVDKNFSAGNRSLTKFNPLTNWTSQQVWDYIVAYQVPFNPLHARGFRSIGCEPCTRPTHPGQHEREGRWWWEDSVQKECGLHKKT
ncbi:MAG TPA: phosphoadenylyl-sulfate reductase [Crenotrichaceae bacterium]|nr:phosphoadenylyl-sulfate reductase [Crenotrichaceae bacterium]